MKILICVLLCFPVQQGFTQHQNDTVTTSNFKEYIGSYWQNGTRLVSQPTRWRGRDWAIFGGSLAITGGLTRLDEDLNKPFKKWNERNTAFGKTGALIGSTPVILGSALLVTGISFAIKNPKLQNFALDNLQGYVFTGGLTFITKKMFGRARPNDLRGANYWDGPFKKNDFASFFSGHSSIAFSTATMIFLHSHKKPWVGLLCYGLATGVGISRMQYQKHWTSDVFLGAVTGWATSAFVYHQNEKRRQVKRMKSIP